MAMTEDDANTLETNLRDKGPAPLEKDGDDISALSTSTRTSKAERIADERVLEVSKQHQLAFAEARAETQKMKEAFELCLEELTKAISAAPAPNTLTPDSATDTNNIKQAPAINPSRNTQGDLNVEPTIAHEKQGNQSDSSHVHTVGKSDTSSSSEDSSSENESDNGNTNEHSDEDNGGNEQNEVFTDSAISHPVQHSHSNTQYDADNDDADDDKDSDPGMAHIGSTVQQRRHANGSLGHPNPPIRIWTTPPRVKTQMTMIQSQLRGNSTTLTIIQLHLLHQYQQMPKELR